MFLQAGIPDIALQPSHGLPVLLIDAMSDEDGVAVIVAACNDAVAGIIWKSVHDTPASNGWQDYLAGT